MDWILTWTGRAFRPLAADPGVIDIRDIAHSLSLLCRFNGHCREFYSVAEHCVRVSALLHDEHALWGLLHDAAEAYVSDLPRPIKRQLPAFGEIEDRLLQVVAQRFGLSWPLPAAVLEADDRLLATEMRDLMVRGEQVWRVAAPPLVQRIEPWPPARAERAFLERFQSLVPRHGPLPFPESP